MEAIQQHQKHVILLGMSLFNPRNNSNTPYERCSYTYDVIGSPTQQEFLGCQTNEAPTKFLLDRSCSEGSSNPQVDKIVYLLSKECRDDKKVVASSKEEKTTDQLFREDILDYYRGRWGEPPEDFFVPINYNPVDSDSCLGDVIHALDEAALGGGCIVDIDTTGALRDVVNLMTLTIQVVQMKSQCTSGRADVNTVELGTTVYANLTDREKRCGTLTVQNETYGLIGLINATDAFTRYGKAEGLTNYFEPIKGESKQVWSLCQKMQEFSDSLALCRSSGIILSVREIQKGLDELDPSRVSKTSSIEDMPSGELLFRSLVPSIKAGFVPDIDEFNNEEKARQSIAIIRWLVDHQMLQQALAFYIEQTPTIIEQLGYLTWPDDKQSFKKAGQRWKSNDIMRDVELMNQISLALSFWMDRESRMARESRNDLLIWPQISERHPSPAKVSEARVQAIANIEDRLNEHRTAASVAGEEVTLDSVRIDASRANKLRAILIWYWHLKEIRNATMHANADDKGHSKDYNEACAKYFDSIADGKKNPESIRCTYRTNGSGIKELSRDMELALQALEGRIVVRKKEDSSPSTDQLASLSARFSNKNNRRRR